MPTVQIQRLRGRDLLMDKLDGKTVNVSFLGLGTMTVTHSVNKTRSVRVSIIKPGGATMTFFLTEQDVSKLVSNPKAGRSGEADFLLTT